jgi:hypothetical protein
MLHSLMTDPIAGKVQCGQRLCETKSNERFDDRYGCYIVLLESIAQMSCSFITDLIVVEVQCGQRLCETNE